MESALLLVGEVTGMTLLWTLVPVGCFWLGAQAGEVSDSLFAALAASFLSYVAVAVLMARLLTRLDLRWIGLRRRAGHRQPAGALSRVVVVSGTFALIAFYLWYYVLTDALRDAVHAERLGVSRQAGGFEGFCFLGELIHT